jgi:hypothetical protein
MDLFWNDPLIKKSKKKQFYKIDRAVCWMEKNANHSKFNVKHIDLHTECQA